MFFVVASIAGLFVEERACGALARLRNLGARPWQLIVSKICPYLAVNAVQAALMLAVGVWLMPRIGGEGLSLQGVNWAALLLMLLAHQPGGSQPGAGRGLSGQQPRASGHFGTDSQRADGGLGRRDGAAVCDTAGDAKDRQLFTDELGAGGAA
jgi:hypothetical protein